MREGGGDYRAVQDVSELNDQGGGVAVRDEGLVVLLAHEEGMWELCRRCHIPEVRHEVFHYPDICNWISIRIER